MTITATVQYKALRNGDRHRYVVTLSNGTVAKREGVRTYSHLAIPINQSGSHTSGSNDLGRLLRECGGLQETVIVETATGRVIDCSRLPSHTAIRRDKARAAKAAAEQKRLQEYLEKAPKRVMREFKRSLDLFRSWIPEWEGKDQDRVDRLNDLVAWRERCIEALENVERADLIAHYNTGTTSAILLQGLIEAVALPPA